MEGHQKIAILKVGQDNDLPIRFTDQNGDPIKLTEGSGLTEITCHLPTPSAPLALTMTGEAITVIDGEAGRASVRVSKENMALLNANKTKPQSFEAFVDRTIDAVTDRKVARFENQLLILPALL